MFEKPAPQSDTDQGPGQTEPAGVNPVITVNEPDKVSRPIHTHTHTTSEAVYLHISSFLVQISLCALSLSHLQVAPSVNRSGRMNLFSLMQSISELDDVDKGQVNEAQCQSLLHALHSLAGVHTKGAWC